MNASAASTASRAEPPSDVPYRLAWRSRRVDAGAHRAAQAGAGGLFRDLASLLEHPDPRRIDVRRTLSDPYEALHVRRFEQPGSIDVVMLIDVSASVGFEGHMRKMAVAAELAGVLARSARRIGDRFGLVAAGGGDEPSLVIAPTRSRASETEMIAGLGSLRPAGRGTGGLAAAAATLGRRRALVFLVSDFHFPEEEAASLLDSLRVHDVVPILLRDRAEIDGLPRWGLLSLADLETGRLELIVMRPGLRKAWEQRDRERRAMIRRLAIRHGRELFEVTDLIEWNRFTSYLAGGAA